MLCKCSGKYIDIYFNLKITCFIPATTKFWNELPSMIVEATELQKFKIGANAFLLGVDGL